MAVSIRERSVDDIAPAVPLLNEIYTTNVTTEAGSRHRLLNAPPEARRNWWAAREGETLVGWGTAAIDYETSSRSGYVGASVLESHRRRGIGTDQRADARDQHPARLPPDREPLRLRPGPLRLSGAETAFGRGQAAPEP